MNKYYIVEISNALRKGRKAPIVSQYLADVEFGVLHRDCENFGICRINKKGAVNKATCNKSEAVGLITIFKGGKVAIDFLKSTIRASVQAKYFSDGSFLVEEDYQCDCSKSDEAQFAIKSGYYSIDENESFIRVQFD